MNKDLSLFERIKEFVKLGYSNIEIAYLLDIKNDSKYIQRVRRAVSSQTRTADKKPTLTPKKYYSAMKQHNGTRDELAAKLGCSRVWLNKFEKSTGAIKKIASFLYFNGMSIKHIARTLGTKESIIEEINLTDLPTIGKLKNQIKQALDILEKAAEFDDEIEGQFYELKRIFERLK